MTIGAERPAGLFAASAEAGRESGVRPARAAFTLLEILLALALIALLLGATISLSTDLLGKATPEDVFWQSLTEARKEALTTQQEVRLGFDNKGKAFLVGTNVGAPTATATGTQTSTAAGTSTSADAGAERFPVANASKLLTISFLPLDKTNSSLELIGGVAIETDAQPFVTFYGDGTCSPFRVQFSSGGPVQMLAIDPWTCTEVLEGKK